MACHGRLKTESLEVIAGQFSGEFLQGMMERVSLLPDLTELHLKGNFGPDDALVLQHALMTESAFTVLVIDAINDEVAFELITHGLMLNEWIEDVILDNPATSRNLQICGGVSAVLARNATIRRLVIKLFHDDPELDNFRALALIDPRLEITVESAETSDSEQASFDVLDVRFY